MSNLVMIKEKFSFFLFYICVISFDETELGFRGFGVGRCEIFAFWSGNMGAIIVLVRIKISKPQVIKPLTSVRIDLGKIFSEIVIENPDFFI